MRIGLAWLNLSTLQLDDMEANTYVNITSIDYANSSVN